MYDRILVALDGSALSEEVLPYAHTLAAALDAQLTLFRVTEREATVPAAQDQVRSLAAEFGGEGSALPRSRSVSADILAEANRIPHTLLAVTSRGRGGLLAAMLGSVARELVQSSRSPVLVYRPQGAAGRPAPPRVTGIVLPLDGGRQAESMQDEAAGWAKTLGVPLNIVQVLPPNTRVDLLLSAYDVTDDSYVRGRAREITRKHGLRPHWEVLYGQPARALTGYLQERQGTLVVMAAREQPAVKAAVLGSVTGALVHQTDIPILVRSPGA